MDYVFEHILNMCTHRAAIIICACSLSAPAMLNGDIINKAQFEALQHAMKQLEVCNNYMSHLLLFILENTFDYTPICENMAVQFFVDAHILHLSLDRRYILSALEILQQLCLKLWPVERLKGLVTVLTLSYIVRVSLYKVYTMII